MIVMEDQRLLQADPAVDYTTQPVRTMNFVGFMHAVGRLKHRPAQWTDLFFPEAHGFQGADR